LKIVKLQAFRKSNIIIKSVLNINNNYKNMPGEATTDGLCKVCTKGHHANGACEQALAKFRDQLRAFDSSQYDLMLRSAEPFVQDAEALSRLRGANMQDYYRLQEGASVNQIVQGIPGERAKESLIDGIIGLLKADPERLDRIVGFMAEAEQRTKKD
jgi:hypothetical protein